MMRGMFIQFKVLTAFALLLLLLSLNGCGSADSTLSDPISEQGALDAPPPSLAAVAPAYVIQPGDQLTVKFFYQPTLNEKLTVRPDGRISLQLVHEVQAATLTTSELSSLLQKKYAAHLKNPEISVIMRSFDAMRVYVDGEVGVPGVVDMRGGYLTILQAIASAGGFKDSASRGDVLVIRRNHLKKPFVLTIDVDDAQDGTDISQNIALQPYDIVYVPKTAIAHVNTFVKMYIRNNLPVDVSLGFNKNVF